MHFVFFVHGSHKSGKREVSKFKCVFASGLLLQVM